MSYHQKNNAAPWIIIVILILIIAYSYDFLGLKNSLNKISVGGNNSNSLIPNSNNYQAISIKDLAQNPSNYINKKIQIKGDLIIDNNMMIDSEGYIVLLSDNCYERGIRTYHYNTEYSVKGIWNGTSLNCESPIQ